MKNKNKKIQNQVLETMKMFEEEERLLAGPDFYKKLFYKMHTQEEVKRPSYLSLKASLQPLAMGLILAVNIYVGISVFSGSSSDISNKEQNIETFASQYMLANNEVDWLQFSSGEEK